MFLQNSNANTAEKVVQGASEVTGVAWQSIDNLINSIVARLPYILAGFLVLLIFYLIARIIKSVFWSATKRTNLDDRLRILFSRLIVVLVVILGIFTSLTVIIPTFSFGDLITGLGFTSVIIGFAVQDILKNLLSGVLILWQQPFKTGDYIFVGGNQGK
ncbi:MAG TPA: mechanosensitive ion channel domain-containing protein, partial [Pyrinomonadaceae bacterium]|nr:mechanosensitive ion channel domain-containing protein [Pyrinomonadaceae bacterium]